jgi:hypothetical protein
VSVILLQYSVSTCIAHNACAVWLRLSADSLNGLPLRCLRRSSRSVFGKDFGSLGTDFDKRIGQHITGTVRDAGGIEWSFGRKRGLGI